MLGVLDYLGLGTPQPKDQTADQRHLWALDVCPLGRKLLLGPGRLVGIGMIHDNSCRRRAARIRRMPAILGIAQASSVGSRYGTKRRDLTAAAPQVWSSHSLRSQESVHKSHDDTIRRPGVP